jgi:hypothetical protein
MKLRNFTPHAFTFFAIADCTFDQKSRKFIRPVDAQLMFNVVPEETPLRATLNETAAPDHVEEYGSIPQVTQTVGSCDPLPTLKEGELAIVSFVYMSAAKAQGWDCSRLRTTIPCYIDPAGLPAGVVKLSL